MKRIAIIGGTGLTSIDDLQITSKKNIDTPYGPASGEFIFGELAGHEIIFLPRHGATHAIPPHKINYRANIWGLHSIGITHVIAVAAVGGIHLDIPPKKIIIPDQIIDYTHSRKHTFFEDDLQSVSHIDFTNPYCNELREMLLQAANDIDLDVFAGATYGAMQGPRLETAAEIIRMEKDGCDIVGMTGMPEAALAKELGLCYACCALCVNWAAGKSKEEISIGEIQQCVQKGMGSVHKLLLACISLATN